MSSNLELFDWVRGIHTAFLVLGTYSVVHLIMAGQNSFLMNNGAREQLIKAMAFITILSTWLAVMSYFMQIPREVIEITTELSSITICVLFYLIINAYLRAIKQHSDGKFA
jgi:uncharacterized membrane protein